MPLGSGLFSKQGPEIPHLSRGEVADLRKDIAATFLPMAAIAVEEWTSPAASSTTALRAATATVASASSVTSFSAGGVSALAAYPRNVTFTTAGATPAQVPATALITGTDILGKAQTETVTLATTAATASGVKAFKTIKSIDFPAATGTAATVAIGFGGTFGLSRPIKSRAGLAGVLMQISGGTVMAASEISTVINVANKTYTPSSAPNGSSNYCLYYEYVGS